MRATIQPDDKPLPEPSECLVKSVAAAFDQEPALEAVVINPIRRTLSIATFRQNPDPALTLRVTQSLRAVQEATRDRRCSLLEGRNDCGECEQSLRPDRLGDITIRQQPEGTTISRKRCETAPRFWHWRQLPWPKIVPREVEFPEEEEAEEWKPQLLAAGLCGALGLAAAFLAPARLQVPMFVLAYVAGSWFTAGEVWERLRHRLLDVHFLMLAVAVGSASVGAWGEGNILLFLFSLSGALEHYALGRTHREIRSLFKAAPKVATLLDENGSEREVPVESLQPGMRLLIRPGALFPVDAEIAKGETASDESNLTGEAIPVEKQPGDSVLAGTLNLWGAVEVVAVRAAGESALQKIIKLIHEAQRLKAPSQRFTDKFGSGYTYGILALTLVMFLVWWMGLGPAEAHGARSAFYHAMTLLVVASPCALVLSIPSAILAAIAWGARRGILFRGGAAVEKLAEVKTVALDKTGTLTTGELQVETVESFPAGREAEVARLACALERLSEHPLARAITLYGKHERLADLPLTAFESVTGHGIQARHGELVCRLGKRDWLRSHVDVFPDVRMAGAGCSEVWLSAGDLVGRVVLRDEVRPEAPALAAELRRAGLKTIVLTGDRKEAAQHLRERVGVDEVRAELKPEEKVEIIRGLTHGGEVVAMVGDGVNDAPSLAAAHVGVAMGARGSDAALEQAEVVLMHDRLENFLAAFRLSQRARGVIRQNLVISLGTVVVLVGFALWGIIPLTLGVIGHEGSTVVVVMNSLRLLVRKAK